MRLETFFEIFVHKKCTHQDGVEWIKRIVNYWGMLKFIRIEKDGDGAIVDEVHFFSGIVEIDCIVLRVVAVTTAGLEPANFSYPIIFCIYQAYECRPEKK